MKFDDLLDDVTQNVRDILSAVLVGFRIAREMFMPSAGSSSEVVGGSEVEPEADIGYDVRLSDILRMDPLRKEAILSMYGLKVVSGVEEQPDPVHEEVGKIIQMHNQAVGGG